MTCQPCSFFDSNCQACTYDPAFNASSPTNVICSIAKEGYFVESDGSTSPCGEYCSVCLNGTFCTTCFNTFSNQTGVCSCSTLFLAGTSPATCDSCISIIPGCLTCTDSSGVTICSGCQDGFYSPAPYDGSSCALCPSICLRCSSGSVCSACKPGMVPSGDWCVCSDSSLYVNPVN